MTATSIYVDFGAAIHTKKADGEKIHVILLSILPLTVFEAIPRQTFLRHRVAPEMQNSLGVLRWKDNTAVPPQTE